MRGAVSRARVAVVLVAASAPKAGAARQFAAKLPLVLVRVHGCERSPRRRGVKLPDPPAWRCQRGDKPVTEGDDSKPERGRKGVGSERGRFLVSITRFYSVGSLWWTRREAWFRLQTAQGPDWKGRGWFGAVLHLGVRLLRLAHKGSRREKFFPPLPDLLPSDSLLRFPHSSPLWGLILLMNASDQ